MESLTLIMDMTTFPAIEMAEVEEDMIPSK